MATDSLYQHQQQFPAQSHFDMGDAKHFQQQQQHQHQSQHHHQHQHQHQHHPHYPQESAVTHTQDQIGWYFVEQYYTTLSREPEKLHLYYNKASQFCFGNEAEKVHVASGLNEIQSRIRSLDFRSCKVRVLNVDAQGSFDNILVIVIGEISNDGQPSRKFVQTFVLAQQPNGYYVLNDVFRYLKDEDEEEADPASVTDAAPEQQKEDTEVSAPAEAATTTAAADDAADAGPAAPETAQEPEQPAPVAAEATPAEEKTEEKKAEEVNAEQKAAEPQAENLATDGAAEVVDEKLEQEAKKEDETAATTAAPVAEEEKPKEETAVPAAAAEEKKDESEKPVEEEQQHKENDKEEQIQQQHEEQTSPGIKEPEHTPAATDIPAAKATAAAIAAPAQPAKQQEKPAAPAVPMSWANIASQNKGGAPVPAVPIVPVKAPTAAPAAATPAAEKKEETSAPAATTAAAPAPVAPASAKKDEKEKPATNGAPKPATAATTLSTGSSEWQTVSGNEHHVRRQSTRGAGSGRGGASGASGDGASGVAPANAVDLENNTFAYIKNVNEKVDAALLRATLSKFGQLKDFDVSRVKNCAFVDFGTPAAFKAAVAANPHTIGSEQVTVELRRFRVRGDRGRGGAKGFVRGGRGGQGTKRGPNA